MDDRLRENEGKQFLIEDSFFPNFQQKTAPIFLSQFVFQEVFINVFSL